MCRTERHAAEKVFRAKRLAAEKEFRPYGQNCRGNEVQNGTTCCGKGVQNAAPVSALTDMYVSGRVANVRKMSSGPGKTKREGAMWRLKQNAASALLEWRRTMRTRMARTQKTARTRARSLQGTAVAL